MAWDGLAGGAAGIHRGGFLAVRITHSLETFLAVSGLSRRAHSRDHRGQEIKHDPLAHSTAGRRRDASLRYCLGQEIK